MSTQAKSLESRVEFKRDDRVRLRGSPRTGTILQSPSNAGVLVEVKFDDTQTSELVDSSTLLPVVSREYVENLDPLYLEIFRGFAMFNPSGRPEWGVAVQSLHSIMADRGYTLGQVRAACDELDRQCVLERMDEQFYHPTQVGEAIIQAVQDLDGKSSTTTAPPFKPPF